MPWKVGLVCKPQSSIAPRPPQCRKTHSLARLLDFLSVSQHAGLLAEAQDLHKQPTERLEVAAAELTDAAVIQLLVAGQHPGRQILITGPFNPAGRNGADTVGIKQ